MLSGEYAQGYVGGMQRRQGNFTQTICNAKHWSAYDVEKGTTRGGSAYDRGSFDAIVSELDLAETYWPQFRAAVQGAQLGGTMCSYNAVNSVPSCANGVFNNEVLRDRLGFTGMIVSDCGAVLGIGPAQHNYTHDPISTVRAALRGGTDLDCGGVYKVGGGLAQHDRAGWAAPRTRPLTHALPPRPRAKMLSRLAPSTIRTTWAARSSGARAASARRRSPSFATRRPIRKRARRARARSRWA